MTNLTLAIPPEIAQKMKKYPEIRWSRVARQAIQERIELLEVLEKTTDPHVGEEEAVEIALRIHHKARRRGDWRRFLKDS